MVTRNCEKCGEIMALKSKLGVMQWVTGGFLLILCTISTLGLVEIKDFKEKFWEQRTVDTKIITEISTKLDNHLALAHVNRSTK